MDDNDELITYCYLLLNVSFYGIKVKWCVLEVLYYIFKNLFLYYTEIIFINGKLTKGMMMMIFHLDQGGSTLYRNCVTMKLDINQSGKNIYKHTSYY